MRTKKDLQVAVFTALMTASGVLVAEATAQAPVAGKATIGVTVAETEVVAKGWRASKLARGSVSNEKGEKIGSIDDIIIAPDGKLSFAIIDVGGFLGIGSRRVAIPVSQIEFKDKPHKAVLPGATKDTLKNLPEFRYAS